MSRHHADHAGNLRHLRGWKRQPHDPRDLLLAAKPTTAAALSLRSRMPPVRDQGVIGSCTANAGVVVTEFCLAKQTGKIVPPLSRLDLYATTREVEGTPLSEDSGCVVRDVFKAASRYGICEESIWPYVPTHFSKSPPRRAAADALHRRAGSYHAVVGLDQIKACIDEGFPMIFGFDCFQSLMSASVAATGIVPLPTPGEASIGGHCVAGVGFDDHRGALEFQNSWGPAWGDHGFGWLPYDYVARGLAADFWTLRKEIVR